LSCEADVWVNLATIYYVSYLIRFFDGYINQRLIAYAQNEFDFLSFGVWYKQFGEYFGSTRNEVSGVWRLTDPFPLQAEIKCGTRLVFFNATLSLTPTVPDMSFSVAFSS
jgi:hypothetical protein